MFRKFFKWIIDRFVTKKINKVRHQYHNCDNVDIDKTISTMREYQSGMNECVDGLCDLTHEFVFDIIPELIVSCNCFLWWVVVEIILSPIGILIKTLDCISSIARRVLNIKEGESHV